MSLSTPVTAGLAAAVVVGAGLAGFGIYTAVDNGKPAKNEATLVVGTSTVRAEPACFNGGKAISDADLTKCAQQAAKDSEAKKLTSLDVRASDRVGVGVPKDLAEKGWYAFTGSGQNRMPIMQGATGLTYSGSVSATTLMTSDDRTMVTVAAVDQQTNEYYAVWFFNLNNQKS
ncbi:hypothetical protein [Kitasatospora cheerisanensis]|uniref:DUF2771 domain-containing protein n=1 Tax=Kitasatospora cheerisanensis KCTC 2395 TaxID=1348663 RepID=A0A066YUV0_9ACTN|nr:hypothetical protein [Kitasatospora cheerisanensis]KDN83744.1 hypothetical protein KCH_43930 [Kitasatospora cheerisanensis KCTC 2395]